jgi:hypothetical protein
MPTTLESVVTKYLRSGSPAQRTREEYATTLRKWSRWGGAVPLERLGRKEIREFLDWVHEDAAGRHYLTKPEINALYFATHQMSRPRGWSHPWPVGRYWRCALVVFLGCRYRHGLGDIAIPRADPLEAHLVGPSVARPRD